MGVERMDQEDPPRGATKRGGGGKTKVIKRNCKKRNEIKVWYGSFSP